MVTSAHKALPSYSQGALVLARTVLLDHVRLDRGFEATHTTSPAASIMASIDAARALLAREGVHLCTRLLRNVAAAKKRLTQVPGVQVLDGPGVEPTKLVILLAGTGASGIAVSMDLWAAGIPVEMAERDMIVPVVTIADDEKTVARFTEECILSIQRRRTLPRPMSAVGFRMDVPEVVLSPREAFFAPAEAVSISVAIGRVSAELIAAFPPGIPLLAPGERVTRRIIDALRAILSEGGRIAYAADLNLESIRVVRPNF